MEEKPNYTHKILVSFNAGNSNGSPTLYESLCKKDQNPSAILDPQPIKTPERKLGFKASKDIAKKVRDELEKLNIPYEITLLSR